MAFVFLAGGTCGAWYLEPYGVDMTAIRRKSLG